MCDVFCTGFLFGSNWEGLAGLGLCFLVRATVMRAWDRRMALQALALCP